jgi:probable HAF family extracellular repeat protein
VSTPFRTLLITSLLVYVAIPVESARAEFEASIVGLGDLPGGEVESHAAAISGDGRTIVGWSYATSGGQAYAWTASGGMQGGFDPAIPGESTWATDVSSDGSVIVGGGNGYYSSVALKWEAGASIGLGAADGAQATGVSADGTKTAFYERDGGNTWAYLHTPEHPYVSLGYLGSMWVASTAGVSGDGSVVVGKSLSDRATGGPSGFGWSEAFRWDSVNGIQPLGDLPGGDFASSAVDVSFDGSTIVGTGVSAQGEEAFLWTASAMTGLGDLPGGAFKSNALTVSADGTIVGGSSESASGTEAFLWREDTGMQSLWLVLTTMGVDLSGWQSLDMVTGISDDGTRVVGTGTNALGYTEGFLAFVPEPSTGLLLGVGLAALAMRRRGGDSRG